jgi:hypothetical protein
MSSVTRRALKRIAKNIRTNTPRINRKLARSSAQANYALVFTAAKYYDALNRLAEK